MRPQIEVNAARAGTPEALWRERILQWAESGLAQVEFCREHGLSLDEFRGYRTRLSRPAKAAPRQRSRQCTRVGPAFVEVDRLIELQWPDIEKKQILEKAA